MCFDIGKPHFNIDRNDLHSGSGSAKNVKTQQINLLSHSPSPKVRVFFSYQNSILLVFKECNDLPAEGFAFAFAPRRFEEGFIVSHTQPSPRTWEDRFDFYKVVSRTLTIPTFGIYGLVFGVQKSNSFENALIQGSWYFFVGLFCGLIWEWVALIGLVYYM